MSDGDGRAIYKESNFDLINYGRIKMFIHAEPNNGDILSDNEINAFLRFGSDYENNYYEIELPLKITRPSLIDQNSSNLARIIWPEENEINLSNSINENNIVQEIMKNFPGSKISKSSLN